MSGLSVVIPSRSAANLKPCVEVVRLNEPAARILVIDDFPATFPRNQFFADLSGYNPSVLPIHVVSGISPFIFARNVNLGMQTSGDDDIVILNDDALLETPGGFTAMQRAAREHPEYGVISSSTNLAGNPQQQRVRSTGLRVCGATPGNSVPVVAFVCVLIPRRTIELVGLLDERFTAYGWEDNDYCRRVHNAGLKIGVCDGCFVDHAKLHSTFRGQAYAAGDINAGRQIYLDKWGRM